MSDLARVNNAKKKKLSKKKNRKEVVSDNAPETEAESSEEELDLTKECHPISHYMSDRAEMINQMFSVIKGKKLKAMLPPILADMDTEKLKLLCLDQLLGISEKRIQCILEGEVLDSSSESEVLSEESESSKSSKDSSTVSVNESQTSSKRKRGRRKSDADVVGKAAKVAKKAGEQQGPDEGKTLLEILELEMRARAIRALLNQGSSKPDKPQAGNGDVVDLTVGDEEDFPRVIKTEPVSTEQEQTFTEKVEKTAKSKVEGDSKTRRMLIETEMRNRLIKKKTYRTRQQRIENEEEPVNEKEVVVEPVVVEVKQEVEEVPGPTEIVIEDPEDGEVSSDEEVAPIVVKEEKEDSPVPEEPVAKVIDGERITAMDDGTFVPNENVEFEEGYDNADVEVIEKAAENVAVEEIDMAEEKVSGEESLDITEGDSQDSTIQPDAEEESSWRERWLMKDDVQKVVKSSKICGKVKKKRIASKKKVVAQTELCPEVEPVAITPVVVMEGSVTEYQQLFSQGERLQDRECLVGKVGSKRGEVVVGKPVKYVASVEESLVVATESKAGHLAVGTDVTTKNSAAAMETANVHQQALDKGASERDSTVGTENNDNERKGIAAEDTAVEPTSEISQASENTESVPNTKGTTVP